MPSNYEYLRYPPQLYSLAPRGDQAFGTNSAGKTIRKLYHRMQYLHNQIQKIKEFRAYALQRGKRIKISDYQILRYLYNTEFNQKQCLEKVEVFMDWMHDPKIQTLSHKAIMILSEGVIYTYGRDRHNVPVVYLDIAKIKLQKYDIMDYYCSFNTILNLVVKECFIPGVIEKYTFVIDMGNKKFTSLPLDAIGTIIKKMSIVYSGYLSTMLVINTHYLIKLSFKAILLFVHEQTRKKMQMFDTSQLSKMQQYIHPNQMHRKHQGLNADPFDYWPPQVPGQKKVVFIDKDDASVYFSIEDNDSIFQEVSNINNPEADCCGNYCTQTDICQIF